MSATAGASVRTARRALCALLVAFAMLLSPAAMASGKAAAMPHGNAVTTLALDGHCAGDDAPVGHEAPDPGMNCAVACAAFPAVPPLVGEPWQPMRIEHMAAGHRQLSAIVLEGETPPPRMTPRI